MISEAILSAGVGAVVSGVLSKTLDSPQKCYLALQSELKVNSQELQVSCQDGILHNSLLIEAKHKHLNNKLTINTGKRPIRIYLTSIYGEDCTKAVTLTDTGFILNTKEIVGDGLYSLRYDTTLPDVKKFVDAMVDIKKAKEVPHEDTTEYWMHAELKHPQALKGTYGRLSLEDIDFIINVGVSSDIKEVIPPNFQKEMTYALEMLRETDSHRMFQKGQQYIYSKRSRTNDDDIMTVLSGLQTLFASKKFEKFITVNNKFTYSDCIRGVDTYRNVPFPTWPKTMSVISKTDLNLNQCAAEGTVIYKKNDFVEEVRKIFGK